MSVKAGSTRGSSPHHAGGSQMNTSGSSGAEDTYGNLVDTAVKLIQSYNEITSNIDSHSDKFFEDNGVRPNLLP